jgi:uncharacterized membrane protein
MKLSYLWRGTPGHPIHPPLTDATIGIYTFATVAAIADVTGISDNAATHGWWLALVLGLIVTVATALTGLAEWLTIEGGTPLRRTATSHALAMVAATVIFLIAAILGKDSFDEGNLSTVPFVLTLIGYALMALGGYLGGTLVFVHGMRVLNLVEEPTQRAVSPLPHSEKEEAEA